ncbi:hypothetical protein C8R46DRAFT_637261 [Mycena filopes]|nr:hypothetical protein C8R46DRAFT_637261 [Mycena filopes]
MGPHPHLPSQTPKMKNLDGVPPAPDYPYYPPDEAYEPEQHYSEDGHSDSSSPFSESSTSLAHDFQQFKPPPAYRFHCNSTKNNTISSFTDPHGNMLAWYSGGSCGFRKRNRSGYEAGYQCAVRMFAKIEEMGKAMPMSSPMRIDLFCRGFGQGREALFKALTTAQGDFVREWIVSITDRTPIKIGGTRAKKVKRR